MYDSLGLDAKILDVQLTGSLANFNYTDHSDLDTHVILDFSEINEDKELVKKALDGKRFIWNLNHDIFIRDHEVEIYFQDVNEPHVASGLYSLYNNEWITEPSHNPPKVDDTAVVNKADRIATDIQKIESGMKSGLDPEEAILTIKLE